MRYRRSRFHKKKITELTDISMTPLIDTALTLLVIFMITAPMMQNAIRVTLPHGQAKESNDTQQELVVSISKEGALFFNGKEITTDVLIAQVKEIVGAEQEKTVFVKADQAVSYGTVIELVDKIKIVGGVKYVALATRKHAQNAATMG